MTFQSSRGVERGMRLLDVRNPFAKVEAHFTPPQSKSELQQRLDRIVHRRNQIVHEGDLQRQSGPRHIKREPVDKAKVADDLA
ncbi:MAG: hypothetical protein QM774_06865 [Gordonia sp. (in: high G+C Gram-positive bacteria)]|uniref:hypothetical protein n=1 Tax=Gordonia sp. (in: high G+C Gram-positive bacteria) TaxID=84139 RepID=UPI0039E5862E